MVVTLPNGTNGAEKQSLINMSNLSYYVGYLDKEFQQAHGNKDRSLADSICHSLQAVFQAVRTLFSWEQDLDYKIPFFNEHVSGV